MIRLGAFGTALLALVCATTPGHTQTSRLRSCTGPCRLLDSLLRDQAVAVLQRSGDTFYVLGEYLDSTGAPFGVATRHWPPLDAPPRAWAESLRVALVELRSSITAAAYLVDLSRDTDYARSADGLAVLHYESAAGICFEAQRAYRFRRSGAIMWGPAIDRPCLREVWPAAVRDPAVPAGAFNSTPIR